MVNYLPQIVKLGHDLQLDMYVLKHIIHLHTDYYILEYQIVLANQYSNI